MAWHALFALAAARATLIALAAIAVAIGLEAAGASALAAPDVAKVIGPDECGECHKAEIAVWRETHHARTFEEMPKKDKSQQISDKLGLKRIKSESMCLTCHFTEQQAGDQRKVIAGISCESCHGGARDWNKPHADFGGKDVTAQTETAEHRGQRLAAIDAAGMIRPARIYDWANNCYSCHTVPQEKLVNDGGHPAGSAFELVAWSQGEIRHNLWYGGGKENREETAERKRVIYVLGRLLDLEHGLRGVAKATVKADYALAMAKRAQSAAKEVKAIADLAPVAEVKEVLDIAGSVQVKLNNEAELSAAADRVAGAARRFAQNNSGAELGAIDPLLPGVDKYKGKPAR